jgi:hypothetical protein
LLEREIRLQRQMTQNRVAALIDRSIDWSTAEPRCRMIEWTATLIDWQYSSMPTDRQSSNKCRSIDTSRAACRLILQSSHHSEQLIDSQPAVSIDRLYSFRSSI